MARALEPSQPRCPGLSPPGSFRPPGCTLIGAVPGLLVTPARPREADPALALCWAHRNAAGAHRAAGRGGSCGNTPPFWLWAWHSGASCPLRLLSPCASPPPRGLFPTRRPHPPQESLTSPPPPHPGSFLLFHARPVGTGAHGGPKPGFMAGLCFTPLGLGGTDSTPILQLVKPEVQRGEQTRLQSPDWKARDRTGLAWLRNPARGPPPAAGALRLPPGGSGRARPVGQGQGWGYMRGLSEGPGTQRCRGWQGLSVEKLARTKPGPLPRPLLATGLTHGVRLACQSPAAPEGNRRPLDTCPPPPLAAGCGTSGHPCWGLV